MHTDADAIVNAAKSSHLHQHVELPALLPSRSQLGHGLALKPRLIHAR